MARPIRYDSPATSLALRSLRAAVADATLDERSFRELCNLINIHPRGIGHDRVFSRLGSIFRSECLSSDRLSWAGAWSAHVDDWIAICGWLEKHPHHVAKLPGLEDYLTDPAADPNQHPIDRRGLVRHGIPAALWQRHHSELPNTPSAEGGTAAADYHRLLAHVAASYIECRHRIWRVEDFEAYDGKLERPVAPMRTDRISPRLRRLADPAFDALLRQFPRTAHTPDYAAEFRDKSFQFDGIDAKDRRAARGTVNALKRYFVLFLRMLGGWRPAQRARRGWHRRSPVRMPGYTAYSSVPGIFTAKPDLADADADQPLFPGLNVFLDSQEAIDPSFACEESGLAPDEFLEPGPTLYYPAELKNRFLAFRRQDQAVETKAQALFFDNDMPTSEEIHVAWKLASGLVESSKHAATASHNQSQRAQLGLLIQLSLAYGQRLEDLLDLRVVWVSPGTPTMDLINFDADDEPPRATVVVESPVRGDWGGARLIGMRLLGIMPHYRTVLNEKLVDIDREYADAFILPDMFRIGAHLVTVFARYPPAGDRLFGITASAARALLKQVAPARHGQRITFGRTAAVLPRVITFLTGDQSLAWILAADARRAGEPRMHYTRHTVYKLQDNYLRAVRYLGRAIGMHIKQGIPTDVRPATTETTTGARFVLAFDELKRIIEQLLGSITDPHIRRNEFSEAARYHNDYLLYLLLFQGIDSSIRAVVAPDELFHAWREREVRGSIITSLSDKTGRTFNKSRLAMISPLLERQFRHFNAHERHLSDLPDFFAEARINVPRLGPYYWIDTNRGIPHAKVVTPSSITNALKELTDYPIQANFHRAFLRTELLARDCPAQVVDTFLGHAGRGESAFGTFSSFDYRRYRAVISSHLEDIRDELGIRVVASRLIPFKDRPREDV